ncbi:MAG: oligosaccharide flippase family protein [Desulfobacterium sp.]|nr:oligosaccharide flippase family protein [Desulfobacterium sp.]MBU3948495.1 oligosaccharide flippase family protein [Pseudomonadota bacterium]MBU4036004.1 oligosaccharide flippase family protein [Pseudomonadota bacterium]
MIDRIVSVYRSNLIINRFFRILSVDVLINASGFILLPVYLKLMTQEEYGLYGYLTSIIAAFALCLNLGLYVSQIKLHSVYEGKERGSMLFSVNALLSVSLCIMLVATYLSGVDYAIVSFMFSHPINYADYRMLVFLSVAISVFSVMVYSYFMASENIALIQLNNLAKLFLINAVVIYFLYSSHSDAVLIRLKYTVEAQLVILIFFGVFLIKEMHPRFRFKIAWRSLKIGIPMMLSAIFAMLYNLSDRFILEKYTGFDTLAIYNLGVTIASVISILMVSFQGVYAPIFFKEKDPAVNFESVKRILKIAIPGFMLIGAGLILASWVMIHANIFNKEYGAVIFLLPFLLISSILQAVTHLYMNFITFFEITYVIFFISVVSNIGNVALNILLIPQYNIYGAAFATVVATAIAFLLSFFYVKRRVRLSVCTPV